MQRLSRMSGEELYTRVSQAVNKRLDLVGYRLGRSFTDALCPAATQPEFFFSPDELTKRVALLQKYLPAEAARICEEADAVCQHRFDLLGYSGLDYGKEIDWHLDAVHGKRAPLKPWYKINFLDFNQVGDHKVTWELNRHQHMVTLAKAWALTHDERYAKELAAQWQSWQRSNPYPIGINWGSALEVAFRSMSWLWVANLLDETAPLPDNFRADLTRGLAFNARYIEKYLSTYFSPNTHLLGEGVALFFIGTLCPQLSHAARWKDLGWKIVLEAAKRQVRSDGVYFEQALHYHVYALDFFLHARSLAARNNVAIPAEFDAVLEKMLDVVRALSQAGPPEGFGDDDGGRVFNPRRNRTEHMTDPLAMGAAVYGREPICDGAVLTEEALWLFGEKTVKACRGTAASSQRSIHSAAFPAGGIYILAGSFPSPHQIAVDAGPQGVGRCGHGHADALSIRMAIKGRRVLVDPGTGAYISDDGDRAMFRSTGAHNTVRVDEQDQAAPAGPFAWTKIPTTKVERWVRGGTFDFLAASHDGYSRLPSPVIHRRFVFRGPDGLGLVRDCCEGKGRHLIESFWHFAEDVQIGSETSAIVAQFPAAAEEKAPHRLAFMTPRGSEWKMESGSGLISPAYGIKNPAPIACMSGRIDLPAECTVLIALCGEGHALGEFNEITDSVSERVRAYRYQTSTAIHTFCFGDGGERWSSDGWASDASFLYCVSSLGNDRPKLSRVIMVGGSFAKRGNKTLISHERKIEHCEWTDREGILSPSPNTSALEMAERS